MENIKITLGEQPEINAALDLYTRIGWGTPDQYDLATLQTVFSVWTQ